MTICKSLPVKIYQPVFSNNMNSWNNCRMSYFCSSLSNTLIHILGHVTMRRWPQCKWMHYLCRCGSSTAEDRVQLRISRPGLPWKVLCKVLVDKHKFKFGIYTVYFPVQQHIARYAIACVHMAQFFLFDLTSWLVLTWWYCIMRDTWICIFIQCTNCKIMKIFSVIK